MIRTKDLEIFLHCQIDRGDLGRFFDDSDSIMEYRAEIVARLRAYDKLKESIEKLLDKMSRT